MKIAKKGMMCLVLILALCVALPVSASAKESAALQMTLGQAAQNKDLSINAGESTYLSVTNGQGGRHEVASWKSSNSKVLRIKKYNKYYAKVTAVKPGTSKVTAKLANGRVFTAKVIVNKILHTQSKVTVQKGKSATVSVQLNTTKKGAKISAKSANKSVATVKVGKVKNKTANLKINGKKKGTTTITVSNNVDNEKVKIKVTVKKKVGSSGSGDSAGTVRRTLVIGQGYPGTSSALPGCPNNANAMSRVLKKTGYSSVNTLLNASRSQMQSAISSSFSNADADDVSLVYYTGHGLDKDGALVTYETNGSNHFLSLVKREEFANMLEKIPGKVVVILDSCFSGMYINRGTDEDMERIQDAWVQTFAKRNESMKNGELCSEKFQVITASAKDESSWAWSTKSVFTSALVDGVGYGFDSGEKLSSAPADTDGNNKLTLKECYKYTAQVVLGTATPRKQHVRCYPDNSSFLLFKR